MKNKNNIKSKLLLAFGLVLALSLILATWGFYSVNKILNYQSLNESFDDINITVLQLRRAEKDFLMRENKNPDFIQTGESKYLTKNNDLASGLQDIMEELKTNKAAFDLGIEGSLDEMKEYLALYSQNFNLLATGVKERGFKDWGKEGELRKAIHAVEKSDFPYDKSLMLMLRRHEKDFFIRGDLSYQTKFEKAIQIFKSTVNATNLEGASEEGKQEILNYIEIYQDKFREIVEAEQMIGLTEKKGLQGELRAAVHKLEPALEELSNKIRTKTDELVDRTIVVVLFVFFIQLIAGILIAWLFSNKLTKSILQIKDNIVKLSEGVFPKKVTLTTKDELGETHHALNNLVDRIQTAADFADKIGNGELDTQYDENFNNDVLAKSLLNMHEKLIITAKEEETRNWATKGLANFGEVLRSNENNLEELSQTIIVNLVKYVDANQGSLFIVNDNDKGESYLELMACYAWARKKFVTERIQKGEGLAGQAWQEAQTVYLTQVPNDYVKITSGLGEANPNSILIVPLKINEEVFGMIEIASFNEFDQFKIEFVEKLGEIIASTLSSVKINERTKALLETSQQQAEEMRAQEEEMRQNQEELQATQEEMTRQKSELEEEVEKLKKELKQAGKQNGKTKLETS